jgi:large subunit ribosomal protein L25
MKSLSLSAFPRTSMRRKGAKQVRSTGRIPANIYGKTAPAQNLELDSKEFSLLVGAAHSEIILVDLSIKDDPRPLRLALVQDVQHHPLHGHVLHVDLHEVQPTEKVTVRVPVESTGDCAGVKAGGTLEHVLLRLRVRAFPKDLPDQILVDVTSLEVGKTIHIGDIQVPPGVELLGNKDTTVLACAAPLTAEPEADAVAEGAKQPEMIKEKKTDEAAPAAAKAADKKK